MQLKQVEEENQLTQRTYYPFRIQLQEYKVLRKSLPVFTESKDNYFGLRQSQNAYDSIAWVMQSNGNIMALSIHLIRKRSHVNFYTPMACVLNLELLSDVIPSNIESQF